MSVKSEGGNFTISFAGLSNDLRTNKWMFQCNKCRRYFSPQTTMMAVQTVTCPTKKCNNEETINYNNLKI